MAKFGKQAVPVTKSRNKVEIAVDQGLLISRMEPTTTVEQVQADVVITNLALTKDKNARVMDVAAAIAEEQADVFIAVPPSTVDNSQDTYMVRNALIALYRSESENGTVIRFPLFKKIVDDAVATQDKLLGNILDVTTFDNQLSSIQFGDMYSILNGNSTVNQFVSNNSTDSKSKQDQTALWVGVGIAFLSFELMGQFHKLAPMFTAKRDVEDLESPTDSTGPTTVAMKVAKYQKLLLRIAEAVVLFALIHKLSKAQATTIANAVVPPSVAPELQQEFTTLVSTTYDNPPADISALITEPDNGDELIVEYCMRRIDAEKEQKRFNPWLVYAIGKIRDLNINDLSRSLAGTSDESQRIQQLVIDKQLTTSYRAPTFTRSEQTVQDSQGVNIFPYGSTPSTAKEAIASQVGDPRLTVNIGKYLPIGEGQQTVGVSILDYMQTADSYATRASLSSDFYMNLMQNNKYTPELVCCILKFLGADLNFLKSLRNMLTVFSRGMGFRLGDLLSDLANALFTDIRNRLLTYAVAELSKLMAHAKKPILDWIDRTSKQDEFLAFCTPLVDMAYALLGVLNEFEDLLRQMLAEILSALMTFELHIDNAVISLNGTSRYLNIIGILDSLIFALEHGRLCNQSALQPADIHPDAIPIISSLSTTPTPYVTQAIDQHKAFSDAVKQSSTPERQTMLKVQPFEDPVDPNARGAVSLNRRDTGETMLETIASYAPKCGAFNAATQFNRAL